MFPAAPKDTKLTENEIKLTEKSYLDPDMPIGPQVSCGLTKIVYMYKQLCFPAVKTLNDS